MKDMIQRMTDLENQKTQLDESIIENGSGSIIECGDMPPAPMDRGNPVSISVNMNASGKEHVADLLDMMKKAGLGGAEEMKPDMMPMRMDMERLRDVVDGPKSLPAPEEMEMEDEEIEEYDNEPEEDYKDTEYMTKDLSGGLNREKKAYKAAQPGDNAMSVAETLYKELKAQYEAKK